MGLSCPESFENHSIRAEEGLQFTYICEHLGRALEPFAGEAGEIQRSQTLAAGEHGIHVPGLCGVEAAEIRFLQTGTASKEVGHIGDLSGVEIPHIHSFQHSAAVKHGLHICQFRGAESGQIQLFQIMVLMLNL